MAESPVPPDSGLRVFSFGGGVQSTAALVLAAQGKLDYRTFLFSNVGHDSEAPETLGYVEAFAKPFARANGLDLVELHRVRREGSAPTLLQHLVQSERSIGIPVRIGSAVGAPGARQCTTDWKIRVIGRWLKAAGASPEKPATVGLGISMDELERMRPGTDDRQPYQVREYPLIDLRLYRDNCLEIVRKAGLPEPPKSACWFCPLHRIGAWQEMARKQPVTFQRVVDLEVMLNARQKNLGKDEVFFTSRLKPLSIAVHDDGQLDLFDGCESGYCMT